MGKIEVECVIECSECGRTLTFSDNLTRHGALMISVDPCDKCIGDANSDGYREGKDEAGGEA